MTSTTRTPGGPVAAGHDNRNIRPSAEALRYPRPCTPPRCSSGAVKVLAGAVVPHGRAGIGVPCRDLHVAQVHAGVKHRGHERVPEHVGVYPREAHAGASRELAQSSRGRVSVHPGAASAEQQRSTATIACRRIDSPAHRGRKRHQDDFAALALHPQDPVSVLLAEVVETRPPRRL